MKKTYSKKKTTKPRAKRSVKKNTISKAQVKSFMASVLEKQGAPGDEGKKSKSKGRRAGL